MLKDITTLKKLDPKDRGAHLYFNLPKEKYDDPEDALQEAGKIAKRFKYSDVKLNGETETAWSFLASD